MGTTFRLVAFAADEEEARAALSDAAERIHAIDEALSDYDPASELSLLSAASAGGPTGPVPVSADLFRVLAGALEVSRRSAGAFDVTVGPFSSLWRESARSGALPSAERLARARRSVGWRLVALDARARTVTLGAAGMRLDLGGIAKGYALDEALAAMARRGVERALVDGGGDVAVGAPPPGRRGWRIALAATADELDRPREGLELVHAAVATSGDLFRAVEIDGVRYSHVLDPRTGLGVSAGIAASVVAPTGMEADALASALCVMGPEAGIALIEELPGVEARIVAPPPAGARSSSGWSGSAIQKPGAPLAARPAPHR